MEDNTVRSWCHDPSKLARMLKMNNDWRRGIGKYAWSEDPTKVAMMPFTPHQLTMIINATIRMLKGIAHNQRKAGLI